MSNLCLSKDELKELTGKVRPSAQSRALNTMGIDHILRPDGTIAVYRHNIEAKKGKRRQVTPNFSGLSSAA